MSAEYSLFSVVKCVHIIHQLEFIYYAVSELTSQLIRKHFSQVLSHCLENLINALERLINLNEYWTIRGELFESFFFILVTTKTIEESSCHMHQISNSSFFTHQRNGCCPDTMKFRLQTRYNMKKRVVIIPRA